MNDSALAQLLRSSDAKASGEFVCGGEGAEIHVFLQAGRVAWATNSLHPLSFKRRLKDQAQLDDDAYQQVMAECHLTHAPIGETLVAWKLATLEQVRDALSCQIVETLELLEECLSPTKAVFLSRAKNTKYSDDLTFDLRELLPPAPPVEVELSESDAPPLPSESALPPPPTPPTPPPASASTSTPAPAPVPAPLAPTGNRRSSRRLLVTVAVGALVAAAALAGVRQFSWSSEAKHSASIIEEGATKATASSTSAEKTGAPGSSGITDTEVLFGMSSAFSGAVKELGRDMRRGFELAFAVANDAGGVHGRKLKLVALDDGYDPGRTLEVMQELVERRKVFAIVGNMGSSTAAVSLPYVLEKRVVFFGPLSGSAILRKRPPDRYVFNYRPSYAEETAAAVRYLVGIRRIPTSQIGVFYQDDEFGKAGLSGVEEQLLKEAGDPAQMVRMIYRRNSANVAEAVQIVAKERARLRAVVMVATSQAAIQFIQQTRDLGATLVFSNVSAVDSNALAEALVGAGKSYTNDVMVTQIVPHPNSSSTAALEYQSAMKKFGNDESPGFVAFEGFIGGKILVEGLRRAGRDFNTESLIASLEELRNLDLGLGVTVTFTPTDHQASHKVWGTALQPDGSFKSIKLE